MIRPALVLSFQEPPNMETHISIYQTKDRLEISFYPRNENGLTRGPSSHVSLSPEEVSDLLRKIDEATAAPTAADVQVQS